LNLSVSVGVSNSPVDGVTSAGALIELAGSRLKAAQQSGGNCVIACKAAPGPVAVTAPRIDLAIALAKSGHESELLPHLAELGSQVLPLLKLLDREFVLGLPMAEIEKKFLDPAREAKDVGQD
jgi:hypothetical protein